MASITTHAKFETVACRITLAVLALIALHTPAIDTLMAPALASCTSIKRLGKFDRVDPLLIQRRAVFRHVVCPSTLREIDTS